ASPLPPPPAGEGREGEASPELRPGDAGASGDVPPPAPPPQAGEEVAMAATAAPVNLPRSPVNPPAPPVSGAAPQPGPGQGAGPVEVLAQQVDEVAPVALRQLARLRGEESEGRRAGVGLRHVAQLEAAAGDQRRRMPLLHLGQPAVEDGRGDVAVPGRVRRKD